MNIGAAGGLSVNRRRRVLQIIFVFVNLALVEAHLPGPLWLAIGSIFWIALVLIAASGSSLVCGTMCWVGAIQDFAEPLARSRVRLDPRWGRGLTLAALLLWIPIGWFLWPNAALNDRTPLDLDPSSWQRHVFGLSLALVIPVSVTFLGKRGLCRYLCPFNTIVDTVRRVVSQIIVSAPTRIVTPSCVLGGKACGGCAPHAAQPLHDMKGHGE
jgi:hypothetical protein